ncbi:Transcriptional regulatory protein sin3 [Mortierella alpina]|nr:Transcriptional regulatory protein sin3 [Mortierella alpina]
MLSSVPTGLEDGDTSASFALSLSVAPLSTGSTIHDISLALGNNAEHLSTEARPVATDSQPHQQPETRLAVAELLVSLAHSSRSAEHAHQAEKDASTTNMDSTEQRQRSPIYRSAVDYVGLVKKAYESNPRVYTEFLDALEKYHGLSSSIEQLVRTVMALFQDQPDLLMGFKEFLPEAQGLLNQLVPPMMYSDYKVRTAKPAAQPEFQTTIPTAMFTPQAAGGLEQPDQQEGASSGHAAADFLSNIKELSKSEPDMYQHLITLLRKFQKDRSFTTLYFYVSIILRYHPHLLQRFHNFLPAVPTDVEVTEARIISMAPPEELVVSPDFIEAKDFVQTVKYEARSDMSMYDRFIFALEKYQRTGWTIDQVYSEVSLIFWNHPDALAGFKQFITTLPQP